MSGLRLSVVGLLVSGVVFAEGENYQYPEDKVHRTALTGTAGTKSETPTKQVGLGMGKVAVLRGGNGVACGLAVVARLFSTGKDMPIEGSHQLEKVGLCKPLPNPNLVNTPASEVVGLPMANTYVRGINVCLAKSKDTALAGISGLRLLAARVNPKSAEVTPLDATEQHQWGPDCEWQKAVMCGDKQIAVGVVGHHSGQTYRGLVLKCVKPQLLPAK